MRTGNDAFDSYTPAIEVKREIAIRSGQIRPRPWNDDEMRWFVEGERPVFMLDTVRVHV